MKRRVLLSLAALLATTGLAAGAEDPAIDGTWQATSAELGGQAFPKPVAEGIKLTLKAGKYEVAAESPDKGTVTYDDASKPKGMEIKGVEGPNRGKTFPAIYELSGDKLTICYDLSGQARPAEFKTRAGTKLFLVTYARRKP